MKSLKQYILRYSNIAGYLIIISVFFTEKYWEVLFENMFFAVLFFGFYLSMSGTNWFSFVIRNFLLFRIWDEITFDKGQINSIDFLELGFIFVVSTIELLRYDKNDHIIDTFLSFWGRLLSKFKTND